jgi:hypothetical protein
VYSRISLITSLITLSMLSASLYSPSVRADEFENHVRPVLQKLCSGCHGGKSPKADLSIDELNPNFLQGGDADTWHDVLNQINLGEMPPAKAKLQPTEAERQVLTKWLNKSLNAVAAAKRSAGGRVSSRRLTRYEYANTMRDLLGVEYDFARELPPEPASPDGFLNNGATLEMSPTQIETYLAVARRALNIAIVEGDQPKVVRVSANKTAVGKLPRRKEGGAYQMVAIIQGCESRSAASPESFTFREN